MDKWEIDDEMLIEYCGDVEFNYTAVPEQEMYDNIDFVPETQFFPNSQNLACERSGSGVQIQGNVEQVEHRPGKEVCVETESVDCSDFEIDNLEINGANILKKMKELRFGEVPPDKKCYCGYIANVVVCRNIKNAGRRFYGCTLYMDHKISPRLPKPCKFFKWIDPPMCHRGVEYALEMQAEVIRIDKYNRKLLRDNSYLQSKLPDEVLYNSERYPKK